MVAAPDAHGVEERDAEVLRHRQAGERARQLEAPRHAEARALMGGEAIDGGAIEVDTPSIVPERAAEAIHQRALAGAVGPDESEPRADGHLEIDSVECRETAEALREVLDLEQRRGHRCAPRRVPTPSRPTIPLGAPITNRISSRPTISRLISGLPPKPSATVPTSRPL